MTLKNTHTPFVEARNIGISFGSTTILEGVSLTLHAGEIVTIIGPNGAGKTTLLKIMLNLVTPDTGTIVRQPDLEVGYMPQKIQIESFLPLTVQRFLQIWRPVLPEKIHSVLEDVGIAHTLERPLKTLSGGEIQRALLARALLQEPDILVLDEPAQGVDVQGQASLFALISKIRDTRGCGILVVSHDLHLVMANTDRVFCLNRHLCCSGRPETVAQHPEFQALFGVTADQFGIYQHHHDHTHRLSGESVDES